MDLMFSFFLSLSPIVMLLVMLLLLKMPAKKASACAFALSLVLFLFMTRPGFGGLAITLEKGLVMGIFVGFIAFGAMLLYNLVDMAGGFGVINDTLSNLFTDRLPLFLMICWTFTAFLQGIAGYGLPAVIGTTILMRAGYAPARAGGAALLGHAWAISFGSMGASIFAIQIVTDGPEADILRAMALYGSMGMLCCGLGVCFIFGGCPAVLRGLPYILPCWVTMSLSLLVMAYLEMVSVIGFVTGLMGTVTMMLTYRLRSHRPYAHFTKKHLRALLDGVLPYLLIVILSIGFFLLDPGLKLSFSFPGYETGTGHVVAPEADYVTFNLLKYPFSIILLTTAVSLLYYTGTKRLERGAIRTILQRTWKKIYATELTLLLLLATASLMMDGGMITTLSTGIVNLTGRAYPFMAAFVGTLGAFITGSNTNSNILFGSLQELAAVSLGLTPALMCGVQSIAASVAGAIGPTTTALTASAAGKTGAENEIYRVTLGPTLFTVAMLGLLNVVLNLLL